MNRIKRAFECARSLVAATLAGVVFLIGFIVAAVLYLIIMFFDLLFTGVLIAIGVFADVYTGKKE